MLQKSDFIRNPLDSLAYYSQNFSIVTKWDGKYTYIMQVTDERKKSVVETIEVVDYFNDWDFLSDEEELPILKKLDVVFEKTKTKYIFDKDNLLSSSCTCEGKCLNCSHR